MPFRLLSAKLRQSGVQPERPRTQAHARPSRTLIRTVLLFVISAWRVLAGELQVWTSTEDMTLRLARGADLDFVNQTTLEAAAIVIAVQPEERFQTMLGMGASLEHSTCSNLFRLAPEERARTIERLVSPTRGIGMNLMRLCIGTSDFAGVPWYSYNDLPPGEVDPELKRFNIARDRELILPMVKLAQAANSNVLFFASPWSPPGWMKTTGNMIGGELKPEFYPAYARYFVRFIEAYQAEGVPIYAVTVQNEPGVDRAKEKDPKWHYPSCHWTAAQERDFIRDHLGPALRAANLTTRIWCYDHNYNVLPKADSDGIDHPRTILRDERAAALVDGVAFHHYEGEPSGMTALRGEFPSKTIYFTEGSVFSIWGGYDMVQRLRNWASSFNAWVVMLDEQGRPNNGPFPASRAILKLHSDSGKVEELFEFNNYGQFMKFIQRGAVRIGSSEGGREVSNVAFANPDGSTVLVVANTEPAARAIVIRWRGREYRANLPAKAVSTFLWR